MTGKEMFEAAIREAADVKNVSEAESEASTGRTYDGTPAASGKTTTKEDEDEDSEDETQSEFEAERMVAKFLVENDNDNDNDSTL
eukprot:CAMPEP_0170873942 /NCGR_PEP_ID=MMETSP0734-20130129/27767_1 /TAXON_ID=186038 /ORGANISM="Fragilariopsis kerguelensis, Strain L26-C5" /LENGTH=84 /DNA_ID=CAMNT_0011254625 /DNA_START=132 /DNA_END=385 /DNA_ORIENTATION=-